MIPLVLRRAAFLALLLVPVAYAQSGCVGFVCSAPGAGTAGRGPLDSAYLEVLGRVSSAQERGLWEARGVREGTLSAAQAAQVRAELRRNVHAPAASALLSDLTLRVFLDSFGAAPHPNNPFFKLLGQLAKKPDSTYASLLDFTRSYLQDPQIDGAREGLISAAYIRSLGRPPSSGDLTYWQAQVKASGRNFTDIVQAGQDWVLSAGNEAEFSALIRRAFKAAGRAAPTGDQIIKIRLANQTTRRTFDEWKVFVQKF
ncbi:hypothetical protein GO986_09645 [Deinococcus sp. HMF7620]|uniref:DUF4214 domain-containing protein n=1 Tax=Deinococcus arboris TaxID=2682977 RepID=A0A7C9HRK0_9DEIO|nr:hypothetical protein [Deinococcus arboris]MVN87029.1 hypothetical protein [Deinococcus arboris]